MQIGVLLSVRDNALRNHWRCRASGGRPLRPSAAFAAFGICCRNRKRCAVRARASARCARRVERKALSRRPRTQLAPNGRVSALPAPKTTGDGVGSGDAQRPDRAAPMRVAQTTPAQNAACRRRSRGPPPRQNRPSRPAAYRLATNRAAWALSRVVEIDTTGGPAFGFEHFKQYDFLRDKEVVLTFDDGPWPENTPAVLKALARRMPQGDVLRDRRACHLASAKSPSS